VPSTRQSGPVDPRTQVGPLVPKAPEGQPMASCSPAGGGANRRIASFLYYSFRRKGNNTNKPSTAQAGRFLLLFQAGERRDGNAASPPLMVGDSRYSAAEPKARRPPTPNTLKSVKRARNLLVSGKK
jgi:hypothetical protein